MCTSTHERRLQSCRVESWWRSNIPKGARGHRGMEQIRVQTLAGLDEPLWVLRRKMRQIRLQTLVGVDDKLFVLLREILQIRVQTIAGLDDKLSHHYHYHLTTIVVITLSALPSLSWSS